MGLLDELVKFFYQKSINELKVMSGENIGSYISYNSMLYLNVIMLKENCTASYIAKALNVTKSAVTVKINELIKQGLVEKRQSETDKRVYYITLRPEISVDLCKYDHQLRKAVEYIETKYSYPHIESFNNMLTKLNTEYALQSKKIP